MWENIDSVGYDPVTSTSGSATTQHAAFTARPRRGVGGSEEQKEEAEAEVLQVVVLVVLVGRPTHRRRRSRAATAATQPRQIEASVRPSS